MPDAVARLTSWPSTVGGCACICAAALLHVTDGNAEIATVLILAGLAGLGLKGKGK